MSWCMAARHRGMAYGSALPFWRGWASTQRAQPRRCHGDDLHNNSGIAFDLRRLKAGEHPRFANAVLHGKNAMPAWQGVLAPPQLEDLWTYIRAHAYQQ